MVEAFYRGKLTRRDAAPPIRSHEVLTSLNEAILLQSLTIC
jgi:hypothetical protein